MCCAPDREVPVLKTRESCYSFWFIDFRIPDLGCDTSANVYRIFSSWKGLELVVFTRALTVISQAYTVKRNVKYCTLTVADSGQSIGHRRGWYKVRRPPVRYR